jgi:hypothetical protein
MAHRSEGPLNRAKESVLRGSIYGWGVGWRFGDEQGEVENVFDDRTGEGRGGDGEGEDGAEYPIEI